MPKVFVYIINLLLVNNHPDAIIGDTEEEYQIKCSRNGKLFSTIWLIGQILILIPLHYKNSLYWSTAMIKNYYKIGYRNLIKERLISIISIAGLGIGIAAAGLIMIYVHFETSYDKFLNDSDKIYRMYTDFEKVQEHDMGYGVVSGALTPALQSIPGIDAVTSLYRLRGSDIKVNNERFSNLNVYTADSSFFKIFSYEAAIGNKEEVLKNPASAVITEKMADKLWGGNDVIGKEFIFMSNFYETRTYTVEAILKNPPPNSHFEFDIILPYYSQPLLSKFGGDEFMTYFKLNDHASAEDVLQLVSQTYDNVNKSRREGGFKGRAGIIPIEDIHLKGAAKFRGYFSAGSLTFVYVLSVVALAILFIAILNFVNLLAAKFQNRFNEIAVRKVVGANKISILIQFISEATLIALISSILSLLILAVLLKDFGILVNRDLEIYYASFHWVALGILLLSVFTAVVSAVFPALRISNMKCANILKDKSGSGKVNRLLPATVIVQFAVVIVLISSIAVIYSQVEFMKHQELGFTPEQLIYFKFPDADKYAYVKNKLEQDPDIYSVTGSQSIPGFGRSGQLGKLQEFDGEPISFSENRVQPDYLKTFGIKLLAGREFENDIQSDHEAVIVNEKFINSMGVSPSEAIGKILDYGRKLKIIGVTADYNYSSFEQNISPLALSFYSDRINIITAKVSTHNLPGTIAFIEKTIKEFSPDLVFDYAFVDEVFNKMYKNIETNNILLMYSAVLAIVLSIMGLFAVTLFAVLRRTKEIGIRKVLGGSVININILLLKDYLVWVILSNIIAWPIAHYALTKWLQSFVVRINLHVGFYIFAGFAALIIAVSTIIYITTRAALNNPVDNLRYE